MARFTPTVPLETGTITAPNHAFEEPINLLDESLSNNKKLAAKTTLDALHHLVAQHGIQTLATLSDKIVGSIETASMTLECQARYSDTDSLEVSIFDTESSLLRATVNREITVVRVSLFVKGQWQIALEESCTALPLHLRLEIASLKEDKLRFSPNTVTHS